MGAQGLFILGFSLSVEVTFTFLSKSYLVHIILENKISPIRLLECAKAFPACHGSLTKSLSPFSSTFPLPLARSQIVDCNKQRSERAIILQSPSAAATSVLLS